MLYSALTHYLDPIRVKVEADVQNRKERILKLVKQIDECKDTEEKKKLKLELNNIHRERYSQMHRLAFGNPTSDEN